MSTERPQQPALTLSEAATRARVSRSTVRRRLDAGDLPNAYRADGPEGPGTGPWQIPVPDLLAAGIDVARPDRQTVAEQGGQAGDTDREQGHDTARRLAELERDLAVEAERRRAAEQLATERSERIDDLRRSLRVLEARVGSPGGPETAPDAPGSPEHPGEPERPARGRSWLRRLRGQ